MKMNKNELQNMINQIDEELLHEATADCSMPNTGIFRRIVPVAACVILLFTATAAAVLKNGISTDSVQNATGGTKETAVRNQAGEDSYALEAENQEITLLLNQIDNFLQGKELSDDAVIHSVNLKMNPKNLNISNGTIVLADRKQMNHITVDIFEEYITIHIEHDSESEGTGETFSPETELLDNWEASEKDAEKAGDAEVEEAETMAEDLELYWSDLCGLSEKIKQAVELFSTEAYVTVTEASTKELLAHMEDVRYAVLETEILSVSDSKTGFDDMRSKLAAPPAGLFLAGQAGEDRLITESNIMILVR